MVLHEIILIVLVVDFFSGVLHWLEDSYGNPDWPLTGKWVTQPNILHHSHPNAFTKNSWFHSAYVLLILGAIILAVAFAFHVLTWQLLLFVAIGVNANELLKLNHVSKKKRGWIVSFLQDVHLLQSAKHHGQHHCGNKDSHYCVITNFLNPMLDGVQFWRRLEWVIEKTLSVKARPDSSLKVQKANNGLSNLKENRTEGK